MRRGIRPVGAALALFVLAGSGCVSWPALRMEPPEVILVNLTPMESTLFEQRVRLDLRVLNPNASPLAIEGLDFELDFNDMRVARVLGNESFVVPPRGEALVSVTASATLFDLLRQALALSERDEYVYGVSGRVYLPGRLRRHLYFEHTGTTRSLERLLRRLERVDGGLP